MLDFIVKHKFGIIATILFHFILLVSFNSGKLTIGPYVKQNIAILELDYTNLEDEKEIEELEKEIEELEKQLSDQEIYEKITNMMRDKNYVPKDKSSNNNVSEESEKSIEEQLEEKYKKLEQEIINKREKDGKHFHKPEDNTEVNENQKDNNQEQYSENSKPDGFVTTECDVPGRRCLRVPKPSYTCPRGGTVHIDIKVNQKGQVISARFNSGLSTTSNECLVNQSIKYAKRAKINQDFNGASSVEGSITYNFISQ